MCYNRHKSLKKHTERINNRLMNLQSKKEKTIRAERYKVFCDPDFFSGSMYYTRLYGIFNSLTAENAVLLKLQPFRTYKLGPDVPHFSSRPHGKS